MTKNLKAAIKSGAGKRPNLLAGQAKSLTADIDNELIVFNFKFFDATQGQTFGEWEKMELLGQAFDVFKSYSSQRMDSSFSKRFKCYAGFPSKSEFTHPRHIPEDAKWASMHLQGKPCVIGHVYKNIFYVVFLDAYHKFWPTNLQDRGK